MRKLLIVLPLLSFPFLSSATTIEYTSRAAWEAAVGNVSTIGFEGPSVPFVGLAVSSPAYPQSITINQVTFAGQAGPVLAGYGGPAPNPVVVPLSASQNSWVAAWGSGDTLGASLGGMLISLPQGTKAFGVDIMTTFQAFVPNSQAYFDAVLSDGEVFNSIPTYAPPTRGFVGFVSTNTLSSVYLNSSGSFAMIDNFSLPSASLPLSPAPEPSTSDFLWLGGLAAAGVVCYGHRSSAVR